MNVYYRVTELGVGLSVLQNGPNQLPVLETDAQM